ncbi:hypothetical protein C8Q77DRAFT_875166 [Trametes polyzona]|nr:hypothetical protein C8Q77DRAFT_875166 [Trametes polyzona]
MIPIVDPQQYCIMHPTDANSTGHSANSLTFRPLGMPEVPTLDSTFGSLLVGTFISLILYGVSLYQLYRYLHHSYRQDSKTVKVFVFSTISLETLLTLATVLSCYHYLVVNHSNPSALVRGIWSFDSLSLLAGLTMALAQCFFARRVYILRPKLYPLAAISILFALTAFVLSAVATVKNSTAVRLDPSSYVVLDATGFGAGIVSDTLTTSVLIAVLRQSRTGWRRTDRVIDRLILYCINTGLLTVIFDILALAFGVSYPNDLFDFGIAIVAAKVYSNSLLAILNALLGSSRRWAGTPRAQGARGIRQCARAQSAATSPLDNHGGDRHADEHFAGIFIILLQ